MRRYGTRNRYREAARERAPHAPQIVGRTLKHSDFLSDRAFHRLDLYAYVCRPLEIDHVMKLFLPVDDGVARCLVFDRTGRDFSERDRSIVDLLRPHVLQLEEAGRLRRVAATLAAALPSRAVRSCS